MNHDTNDPLLVRNPGTSGFVIRQVFETQKNVFPPRGLRLVVGRQDTFFQFFYFMYEIHDSQRARHYVAFRVTTTHNCEPGTTTCGYAWATDTLNTFRRVRGVRIDP